MGDDLYFLVIYIFILLIIWKNWILIGSDMVFKFSGTKFVFQVWEMRCLILLYWLL